MQLDDGRVNTRTDNTRTVIHSLQNSILVNHQYISKNIRNIFRFMNIRLNSHLPRIRPKNAPKLQKNMDLTSSLIFIHIIVNIAAVIPG